MTRILFVCSFNSARSQMAEALARALARDDVEVASAGTHATQVSPLALEALRDRGVDTSGLYSKSLDQVVGEFDYVITLCHEADRECPHLTARRERLHWPYPDPARTPGGAEAIRRAFVQTRDALEARLRQWLDENGLLRDARERTA
ncbi:MAG: arsenate reductase ArsC [Firmicutes bacterium]|nr:arsenate reductase ArsC [Bacillota bacterium]